jgi:hypothetical protein
MSSIDEVRRIEVTTKDADWACAVAGTAKSVDRIWEDLISKTSEWDETCDTLCASANPVSYCSVIFLGAL